jgi:hypothetical protein
MKLMSPIFHDFPQIYIKACLGWFSAADMGKILLGDDKRFGQLGYQYVHFPAKGLIR